VKVVLVGYRDWNDEKWVDRYIVVDKIIFFNVCHYDSNETRVHFENTHFVVNVNPDEFARMCGFIK